MTVFPDEMCNIYNRIILNCLLCSIFSYGWTLLRTWCRNRRLSSFPLGFHCGIAVGAAVSKQALATWLLLATIRFPIWPVSSPTGKGNTYQRGNNTRAFLIRWKPVCSFLFYLGFYLTPSLPSLLPPSLAFFFFCSAEVPQLFQSLQR